MLYLNLGFLPGIKTPANLPIGSTVRSKEMMQSMDLHRKLENKAD
jgi:hypothetical protein